MYHFTNTPGRPNDEPSPHPPRRPGLRRIAAARRGPGTAGAYASDRPEGGFNVRKAEDFVAIYRQNCSGRADPKSFRSRRELVSASLRVDPVPGWGAIEEGDHLFYERQGVDGAEKLVGKARFAMVWVLGSDGKWRVSRVLSYAHGPAN